MGTHIVVVSTQVQLLQTARCANLRTKLSRVGALDDGEKLKLCVPSGVRGNDDVVTVKKQDGELWVYRDTSRGKVPYTDFLVKLTKHGSKVTNVACVVTEANKSGIRCMPTAGGGMDPDLRFDFEWDEEGTEWKVQAPAPAVVIEVEDDEEDDEADDKGGDEDEEEDDDKEGEEGGEEEEEEDLTLPARDAILVALMRDDAAKRNAIMASSLQYSTKQGISKALCPKACTVCEGGHGLWVLKEDADSDSKKKIYEITKEGVAAYHVLVSIHPEIESGGGTADGGTTNAPAVGGGGEVGDDDPDDDDDDDGDGGGGDGGDGNGDGGDGNGDGGVSTPATAADSAHTLMAMAVPPKNSIDVANEAKAELVAEMISADQLKDDAMDEEFDKITDPSIGFSAARKLVDAKLANRDFDAEALEFNGDLATAFQRINSAKRALEKAQEEIEAASEEARRAAATAKRQRTPRPQTEF